jgi:hypothetical protein
MAELENSKVVGHILKNLINISSRKTTAGFAISTMDDLIKKLTDKYDFLKHIEVKDTRFSESDNAISVMADINKIKSNEIGNALYDIIKTMNVALGKNAGHFFIKELRSNINDFYYARVEDMGLDLGLMQLENEVDDMTKKLK